MLQQRETDPAFAPGPKDTQRAHPADIRIIKVMITTQVEADNFRGAAIYRQKPERGVERFILQHEMFEAFETFLEGLLHEAKMVAKRFGIDAVHNLSIGFRVECAKRDAVRPDRLRHRRIHIDE